MVRAYVEGHLDEYISVFKTFCTYQSVSTDPFYAKDVQACARFLEALLKKIGLPDVRYVATNRHPIVFAQTQYDPSKPTVLIYGHYDVQPADPLDKWHDPPFCPTIRDGYLYARGASDDKGQILCHIYAIQAWMATTDSLPINIKLLIEGEEEVGSAHLIQFVSEQQELLRADLCLVSDTPMLGLDEPSICVSLRGLLYAQMEITTLDHDLHSGQHGGAVPNALETLIRMLTMVKHPEGTIQIPGFYDGVIPIDATLQAQLKPASREAYLKQSKAFGLSGEQGYSCDMQRWFRPTFEINGLWGGYMGEGEKTVIPSKAYAKISMRLVGKQDPQDIFAKLKTYLEAILPAYASLDLKILSMCDPFFEDATHPSIQVALEALQETFHTEAYLQGDGGSVPIVTTLKRVLSVPIVLMGFNQLDDCIHSPNERFRLLDFKRGIQASALFLEKIAKTL